MTINVQKPIIWSCDHLVTMYEWTSHDLALAVEKIEDLTFSFSFFSDCIVHCSKFYFRIPFEVVAKNINWQTFDSWLINQLPMMIKEDWMSDGTTIWTNPKYRSHSFYEVFCDLRILSITTKPFVYHWQFRGTGLWQRFRSGNMVITVIFHLTPRWFDTLEKHNCLQGSKDPTRSFNTYCDCDCWKWNKTETNWFINVVSSNFVTIFDVY